MLSPVLFYIYADDDAVYKLCDNVDDVIKLLQIATESFLDCSQKENPNICH